MVKKLFKNAYFLTLFVKVASLCMAIISGALLARFMGPALKGHLASLESVTQVISVILNFGIYHLYPKMIKDSLENARQKFIDIFFFQFILYSLITMVAFLVFKDVAILYYGSISVVSCMVSQLTMMCMVEYPIYRSLSLLIVSVSNMLVTVAIFFIDVAHILLVPVLVYLFKDILFCVLIMAKIQIIPKPHKVELHLIFQLVRLGFIPMITALLLKLNYKVDVIMLDMFKTNDEAIGVYSVAISIASQLWIIPEAFKEVLYSKSTKDNPERSFVSALKISTYSLFILDIVIVALGYWIVRILYGMPFIDAYKHLAILVIGVPFMGVFNIVNPYYLAMGQYTIHLKNLTFGVISNIIVNATLIVPLGATGAAIATSVSQIVCGLYACLQFSRSSKIPLKEVVLIDKTDIALVKRLIVRNKIK